MKTWKTAALAGLFVACNSMHVAKSFEVNSPNEREHVLIATQGSAFKDAVVQGVVARLKTRPAYIEVIDVGQLSSVRESEWNAIVVLHTWEMSKPPESVRAFVDRDQAKDRLVVLATSGSGTHHIEGVDTITSASSNAVVPARVDEIVRRVDAILKTSRSESAR